MKWTYRCRGKDVTLTVLEGLAAVRPTDGARSRAASRAKLGQLFGRSTADTSQGGRFGLDLPSRNRQLFERAGWAFVEPSPPVATAARVARANTPDTEAVQQVFMDRAGNIQLSTDLFVLHIDPEMKEADALKLIEADDFSLVRRLGFAKNAFEVRPSAERPYEDLVYEVQQSERYLFAEPMLLQAVTARFHPTDPLYSNQWQHHNDGSNGGAQGADISSETAWDVTRGRSQNGRSIRIAVIDNGMQVNHPDLRDAVVGGGHFQPDGMGTSTFSPLRPDRSGFPDGAHGTFCLGMAGARANNNRGVCGSAPEADLLPIACAPDQVGTQATLARAVAYAADPTTEDGRASASDGADIIACSLGPNGADWDLTSVLDLAIKFAASKGRGGLGTGIFWAVSNGSVDIARDEISSHPDVIGVGRSNRHDQADGSAFGPKLEFLAPGAEVYSTRSGSRYGVWTGTSFAAPLAAGVGALVLAKNPKFTPKDLRKKLRNTCDKIGGVAYDGVGHNDDYGAGRINAARAVQ